MLIRTDFDDEELSSILGTGRLFVSIVSDDGNVESTDDCLLFGTLSDNICSIDGWLLLGSLFADGDSIVGWLLLGTFCDNVASIDGCLLFCC